MVKKCEKLHLRCAISRHNLMLIKHEVEKMRGKKKTRKVIHNNGKVVSNLKFSFFTICGYNSHTPTFGTEF